MKAIEDYKETAISAYCRLSFDVWYQGYRDDIVDYLDEKGVYKALICAADNKEEKEDTKERVIRIDGKDIPKKNELKTYIEAALDFLNNHEEWSVSIALPFEYHGEAGRIAYDITSFTLDKAKYLEELCTNDYVIQISRMTHKIDKYLKIFPDKTMSYSICYNEAIIKKEGIRLNEKLYERIIKWARRYVEGFQKYDLLVGMSEPFDWFKVYFGPEELGIKDGSGVEPIYSFEKYPDESSLAALFEVPEICEFVKGRGKR